MSIRRKSCEPCFRGRRKCDLAWPVCSRCEKNNKSCHYVYPPAKGPAVLTDGVSQLPSPASTNRGSPHTRQPALSQRRKQSRMPYPLARDDPLQLNITEPSGVHSFLGPLGDLEPMSTWGTDAWIFREIQTCPGTFAKETETFFIHKDLNDGDIPGGPLRVAWGICAASLTLNDRNRKFLFQTLDAEVVKLLAPTPASTVLENLQSTQALVLYQMIRLLYGDMKQRNDAEQQEFMLRTQCLKLLQRLDAEVPSTQGNWKTWLLSESIRRTVTITFKLYSLYWTFKLGMCNEISAMGLLPVSTKTALWGSSADVYLQDEGPEETYPYVDYVSKKVFAPKTQMDVFERMIVLGCRMKLGTGMASGIK